MVQATVVIPTHHRPHLLLRVLHGLAAQQAVAADSPAAPFEVIVVVDGLDAAPWQQLQSLALPFPLHLLVQAQGGASAARNRGVAVAQGEIILFLDDDVVPAPHWLAQHLAAHGLHGDNLAVIGPMWTPADVQLQAWVAWEQAQLAQKYVRMAAGQLQPNPHQFYTGNASVRRTHLLQVGGFDETLQRSEDVELAYRLAQAGVVFCFAPQAGAYHYAERSYAAWLAIPYTYGRNSVLLAEQKGHTAYLATVLAGYHHHHPWITGLLQTCLDRPAITSAALLTLQQLALLTHRLRLTALSHLAYSAIFNLRRYQGLADGLGGRQAFFAAVAAVHH